MEWFKANTGYKTKIGDRIRLVAPYGNKKFYITETTNELAIVNLGIKRSKMKFPRYVIADYRPEGVTNPDLFYFVEIKPRIPKKMRTKGW